jgi:K+-transporting ATPase ATPase B chain
VIAIPIIIPILIPLAKGVDYKPIGASAILKEKLLIYGLGGLISFIRLKY